MSDDRDEAFGEAVYRAWRSGLDSDQVDRDSVEEFLREEGDPWDAAEREVSRLRRAARPRSVEEEL